VIIDFFFPGGDVNPISKQRLQRKIGKYELLNELGTLIVSNHKMSRIKSDRSHQSSHSKEAGLNIEMPFIPSMIPEEIS